MVLIQYRFALSITNSNASIIPDRFDLLNVFTKNVANSFDIFIFVCKSLDNNFGFSSFIVGNRVRLTQPSFFIYSSTISSNCFIIA